MEQFGNSYDVEKDVMSRSRNALDEEEVSESKLSNAEPLKLPKINSRN